VRRQLRRSIEGSAEEKTEGREDRSAERARTGQSHQSHGCVAPKRERGARGRGATKAVPQQRPAPHHEARGPLIGPAEEGRLAPPRLLACADSVRPDYALLKMLHLIPRASRRARERDRVAHIGEAGDIGKRALEAEPE